MLYASPEIRIMELKLRQVLCNSPGISDNGITNVTTDPDAGGDFN